MLRKLSLHVIGPGLEVQCPLAFFLRSNDLSLGESVCSGPEYPLGFEGFCDVGGHSNGPQVQYGALECVNSLKVGNETKQSYGESPSSVEKVPQTPLFESSSNLQSDVNEVVVLFEEDLVKAQISWDIGKALRFKVSNEKVMINALSKVKDCQDFSLSRRSGRPRKNKGCSNL